MRQYSAIWTAPRTDYLVRYTDYIYLENSVQNKDDYEFYVSSDISQTSSGNIPKNFRHTFVEFDTTNY